MNQEPELTYEEHEANRNEADDCCSESVARMDTSDPDIAYFKMPIRISEYAFDALKAEMLRRKLDNISAVLEAVACDLEFQRGRGNPNVTRYRQGRLF